MYDLLSTCSLYYISKQAFGPRECQIKNMVKAIYKKKMLFVLKTM